MATKVWIPKWKLKPVVSEKSSDVATKITKPKLEPVVSKESGNGSMATKGTKSKLEPESSRVDDDDDDDDGRESENEDLGLTMDKLILGPKKKLLVLCLGVFKRPFYDKFLKFCFERFEVALWASSREHNVEPLLSYVMEGLQRKLLFVWDQAECTDSGFSCLERSEKPILLKELKKVWERKWPSGKFSTASTLLIDNDPYKGLLNPPHTGIYPERYNVENKYKDRFLAPKGVLQEYLDGVADAEDVPTYVKEHTFGQQEIATGITTMLKSIHLGNKKDSKIVATSN